MEGVIEYPPSEEGAEDLLNRIRYSESWAGFLCAKIGLVSKESGDGFCVHYHSWGRLRPWKRQWLLEAYGIDRMCVLRKRHVKTLLVTQPTSMFDAMRILRFEFPNYQFSFLPSRHS